LPKKINVVKELPHTLTGKVLKRALRPELARDDETA